MRGWPRPAKRSSSAVSSVRVAGTVGLLLLPSLLLGDVIYLKNGRKIIAPVTREDGAQVYYEMAGGEIAIPKSIVDHVDKSEAPAPEPQDLSPRPQRKLSLPLAPPVDPPPASLKDQALDEGSLRSLADDARSDPTPANLEKLKRGYQAAAVLLTRQGDPEAAILKYREALKYVPHDQALTLALGYLLWQQEHYREAVDLLLPESDRHPESPDYPAMLGSAFYGMENLDQAIAQWNKALAIHDNAQIREAVQRAERERAVSGSFAELRSGHYVLRYDGQQNERLSGEILSTLEGAFQDLSLDLGYAPADSIVVIVYSHQEFRDVTRTPSWVGAANDGKLRLPVSGLTGVTPELARVLKHELTHSFVRQITLGRCPIWFNEGLAQLEEGASTARPGRELARALAADKTPAFATLDSSFVGLPAAQVGLAYAHSLAALEFLRDTYGMEEIRRLLHQMPSAEIDTLLQNELHVDYTGFEREVDEYVAKKYGQ